MAIPATIRERFEQLLRAAEIRALALIECSDTVTGEPRYVVAAVGRADDGDYLTLPFGHLPDDPFSVYSPPAGCTDATIEY